MFGDKDGSIRWRTFRKYIAVCNVITSPSFKTRGGEKAQEILGEEYVQVEAKEEGVYLTCKGNAEKNWSSLSFIKFSYFFR